MLQQCSGYGCRPYGRCQSPAQLGEGRGQRWCVRASLCVCQRSLCCSSVVATGVARMGGAKALLSSARGVGRESMCVCVSERVSESVSERYACACQRESVCVRESLCVCVCACVGRLYAAVAQWLRVSPVWEVPKPCSAQREAWAEMVCVCVRERVREYVCVCVREYVCVSARVRFRESVCVCAYQRPLCCSNAVATGVARMGGAKALLSKQLRGRVWCQSESVCVREGVREIQSLCMCQ